MATIQILMAVYNGERYLPEQLDSIISQNFTDWELLISDDNSTDSSLSILQDYCKRDDRIRLVLDNESFGSAKSHFMALTKIADAPYVMYADQDDIWDQNKIELTFRALEAEEAHLTDPPRSCALTFVLSMASLTPLALLCLSIRIWTQANWTLAIFSPLVW